MAIPFCSLFYLQLAVYCIDFDDDNDDDNSLQMQGMRYLVEKISLPYLVLLACLRQASSIIIIILYYTIYNATDRYKEDGFDLGLGLGLTVKFFKIRCSPTIITKQSNMTGGFTRLLFSR